jgi:hypothetical protein
MTSGAALVVCPYAVQPPLLERQAVERSARGFRLSRGECPIRSLVIIVAALSKTHGSKHTAVERSANSGPVLIDSAPLLAQVDAGSVRAALEHQLAIRVLLYQEIRQVSSIALFVHSDACVIAARRTGAAWRRPGVAAPPGRDEVLCRAVYRALFRRHWCSGRLPVLGADAQPRVSCRESAPRAPTHSESATRSRQVTPSCIAHGQKTAVT